MVVGSPIRIQPEVFELLEKLPCPKVGVKVNKLVKILAQFCLDSPKEFKKWQEKQ